MSDRDRNSNARHARDEPAGTPGAESPANRPRRETSRHRRRAALATLPFLLLGVGVVVFGVVASPRPLFGFLIFPPVVFVSVLTYVAFRGRFAADAEDGGD